MGNVMISNHSHLAPISRDLDGDYTITDRYQIKHPISNRFGWSQHSCKCRGRKTGIVLYPIDTNHKNVVLLVCENCYGYQKSGGTQHEELLRWYYQIYGDSKEFRFVTGFSQKEDGSLAFNSTSLNTTGPYMTSERQMSSLEQDIVQKVVSGQLKSYEA